MANKAGLQLQILKEEQYVGFLRKRLDSANYKTNVSKEEYQETKKKYDKAKFKLKMLRDEAKNG